VFIDDLMKVKGEVLAGTTRDEDDLWLERPELHAIRRRINHINETCDNEDIVFEKDAIKQAPMLKKWGVATQKVLDKFTNECVPLGRLSMIYKEQVTENESMLNLEGVPSDQKPQIGFDLNEK